MKSKIVLAQPDIVVIGGGTGSFTLLSGLKRYSTNLTAIVNMADDGGSTGLLRDELGVLPPGDVRQCLVALSDTQRMRDLFNFRFEDGSLKGHSFGNLFLSAIEKMTNNFEDAVEIASEVLNVSGRVMPVTLDQARLIATTADGNKILGESAILESRLSPQRPDFSFEKHVGVNPAARDAILKADVVVIAPGNLYSSLTPNLIVDGVGQALKETKAKVVQVSNLVTKPGQTDGFTVSDYAAEVERLAGQGEILDFVIYNIGQPTEEMRETYIRDGEYLLAYDDNVLSQAHYTAIGRPLIDTTPVKYSKSDTIAHTRSLIRHDQDGIAREIMKIYFS